MTIKTLIEKLSKYDANAPVECVVEAREFGESIYYIYKIKEDNGIVKLIIE